MFVPSPIVTAPIWGVKNVLPVSGVNENPNLPITVLGATYTSSPNIVHSINTPEEMLDLLPILHLKEILTLAPIIESFSITTPSSIFEYAPI